MFRDVAWRTIQMAVLVTIADVILAFPIAYYMARVASPRTRDLLVVLVLVPAVGELPREGVRLADDPVRRRASSTGRSSRSGCTSTGSRRSGLWLVFTYLWLPFMILPIYAGLERIPSSFLEASADLGGRSLTTFARVILPLAFPAIVAGSIFTFCLTLGDYIAPGLITSEQFIGTVIYSIRGEALPDGRGVLVRPARRRRRVPARRAPARSVREPLMVESRLTRILLRLGAFATLAFIYLPLVIIGLYAFNKNVTQAWPIEKYTTRWFSVAFNDPDGARRAQELASRGARRDRRSRSFSARSPRWPSRATASSGARSSPSP